TTLANRLASDLNLPVFSRDGIYETLFDALVRDAHELPPLLGSASFSLLYWIAGSLLTARQALIVESFFGRPELRTAEFAALRRRTDFEPIQILCKADGAVLLERFLARASSGDRHAGYADLEWLEQNKARLLEGCLPPLALGGQLLEIDTTTPASFDYQAILRQVHAALV
ncbi:MAG: AAA family ATPase, partial [Chloroflexota bacterium]